ncbi:MAG: T9SS type A sorting domain-containing protein [Nitrosopumilus sp.]|nr:T9SS type A sorting domain-containing protein [Nitrosopumilus sp.]
MISLKTKKQLAIIFLAFSFTSSLYGQNRNSIWCFGDSALIDFSNTSNPVVGASSMDGRGSCASIADTSGNILFYAHTRATIAGFSGRIYDSTHQLMQNGNLIAGQGWYKEMVIIPDPASSNLYYLFCIGITNSCPPGLYYSTIDMNLNGGLGAIVQKNAQLDTSNTVDGIAAVKHGNGRDWWLIYRRMDQNFNGNKRYYKYLIDPSGINLYASQAIGQLNTGNGGTLIFNSLGSKLAFVNTRGLIDVMNFNRCTGQLSQINSIEPETPGNIPWYLGAAFSPNGIYLYVSSNGTNSSLFKYDLTLANPSPNRDTIWEFTDSQQPGGMIKLAPDNKIYMSNAWYNGIQYNYPYQDTMYNYVNMNLSVINDPDQPGLSCNFQPYSFYLGGKRTYWGLPNNPNYELGPLVGSVCDTLVGIEEHASDIEEFYAYYTPASQTVLLNAKNIKGNHYSLIIYDLLGRIIFSDSGLLQSTYFTKDIDCSLFSSGIYTLSFVTASGKRISRFVK